MNFLSLPSRFGIGYGLVHLCTRRTRIKYLMNFGAVHQISTESHPMKPAKTPKFISGGSAGAGI